MKKINAALRLSIFLTFVLLCSAAASAQATRTWVSGVGDDANPCSRTAPCKTFAGAISKTAAKGEINVLDPGGFGGVTITKAITIDGGGFIAGVLVSGTNGIVINAGASDEVVLRGLTIDGIGTGLSGVKFLAGGSLSVENCKIFGFTERGITFEPSATSSLFVRDTLIRNNIGTAPAGGGIMVKPGVAGSAQAFLDNVRMERGLFGIRAEDNSRVTIRNSAATGNTNNGFLLYSAAAIAEMNIESSVAANNGTNGVSAVGANAVIRITNVTVTNNNRGLTPSSSGSIVSFGNNRIAGNPGGDGVPTQTLLQQ